ncbi:MAG: D-aminoacyl-tRNA deacylase [Candidatus Diapherotrites archaeon]
MHSIIVSRTDKAGMNIAQRLIEFHGFAETNEKFLGEAIYKTQNNKNPHARDFQLVFIKREQIFADELNSLETDFFIFASKHRSESGRPTLTAHGIGNWGEDASFGGKQRTLVPTSANLLKNYLLGLQEQKETLKNKNALAGYDVMLEVTHHGPFLEKPAVFIELGSSEGQWKDETAARAVADVVMYKTFAKPAEKQIPAIGLGGGHYAQEFSKLVLRKNYALSHIVPEYALPNFDAEMLRKAIACTLEPVQEIVVDWKGLGKEKARIRALLEEQELPAVDARKLLRG